MKRQHAMPFGAETDGDGGTLFRLWAPGASDVALLVGADDDAAAHPMESTGGGWFGLDLEGAGAGTRYRFRADGGIAVPDPASRFQPDGVHAASEVVDPAAYNWSDGGWRGRPWHETVLYELHVGAFSPRGDYAGVAERLEHLVDLGVTALELMPLSDAPGRRNWGYDGVCHFAPNRNYGRPDDLKALVDAAHGRGLMVFLDVVYNHFGPDGNYLHVYAPQFFTERHQTPWGAAINMDGPSAGPVREFFIHNALYWLEEFHIDGLRLDAVHAILDDSESHFLEELAERVHASLGQDRHVHLVLENDDNAARFLDRDGEGRPRHYVAQWNDDLHHALHVAATGEDGGYCGDYADDPVGHLGRTLTEGFAYQDEPSPHRGGRNRGEPSAHLPATAFVGFAQNHDQVGNRGLGERLTALAPPEAVRAAAAVYLLAPSPPMLFMGEEWGSTQPFPFFCDFEGELADAVRNGRMSEFESFPQFRDPEARARIPDPIAEETFRSAVLDWSEPGDGAHRDMLAFYRRLLARRHAHVTPRLYAMPGDKASARRFGAAGLTATWTLSDGTFLALVANLGAEEAEAPAAWPDATPIAVLPEGAAGRLERLPPWYVGWFHGAAESTA